MASEAPPVWFITGCSTGFGRELAVQVLARGWRAVVTARDKARVADLLDGAGDRALALDLDVTNPAQVAAAAQAAEARFGAVDVLVNNAGYGYQASVEEGVEADIRAQFDANVFGLFSMTRAVLPGMRARRRGHVLNVTSVAGFCGFPGSGYYAASKHAVEGWSDALAAEGAPLGIKVTCIEPGPFRTDWAGRSLKQTPNTIADYADTAGARLKGTTGYSGKQPGDPARAAAAMIQVTEEENPPAPPGPGRLRPGRRHEQAADDAGRGGSLARGGAGDGLPGRLSPSRFPGRPQPAWVRQAAALPCCPAPASRHPRGTGVTTTVEGLCPPTPPASPAASPPTRATRTA